MALQQINKETLTVIRPIGRGGMSDLYVVLTKDHQRRVYRRLKEQYRSHRRIRRQFLFGAEVLSRLKHPSIIRFYEAGFDENNLPYLLLEYFESDTLRDLILRRDERLNRDRIQLLIQAAEGLAYIHSRGYFHFDLKPENLLVNREGELRIIDFDLVYECHSKPTKIREISGTPAYLAPEIIRFHRADETTDIFALGVCAFEIVLGRKPLPSDSTHSDMRDQEALRAAAPRKLADLICKCLDHDPKSRYPAMILVVQDLKALL